ncbi:TetR/AcrR family transcriptional regulator [bacterium]|nr:TetR/AcrR family transcriptional regulator [candidate division CSSED10-310 bacterium]
MHENREQRRNRKIEMIKEEIFKACVRVIREHGHTGMTMEEVARQAGYSTGSLYNYFTSKDDLIKATWCWGIDQIVKLMEMPVPEGTSFPAKLQFVLDHFLRMVEENREMYLVFSGLPHHYFTREEFQVISERYQRITQDFFKQGVREGYIPEKKLEVYSLYLMTLADGLLLHWAMKQGDVPLQYFWDDLVDFFMRGVRE